jgi:hypothetical protein
MRTAGSRLTAMNSAMSTRTSTAPVLTGEESGQLAALGIAVVEGAPRGRGAVRRPATTRALPA